MSRGKKPSRSRTKPLQTLRQVPNNKVIGRIGNDPLYDLLQISPEDISEEDLKEIITQGPRVWNRWRNNHIGQTCALVGTYENIEFSDYNLQGFFLPDTNLINCSFKGKLNSDLTAQGATFTDCEFDSDIEDWTITNSQLNHAVFNGNFTNMKFINSNWDDSTLCGKFKSCKFEDSELIDLDLCDITLTDSTFTNSKFRQGRILSIFRVKSDSTSFAHCIFDGMDFTGAMELDRFIQKFDAITLESNDTIFKNCKFKSDHTKELDTAVMEPKDIIHLHGKVNRVIDNQHNTFRACHYPNKERDHTSFIRKMFQG